MTSVLHIASLPSLSYHDFFEHYCVHDEHIHEEFLGVKHGKERIGKLPDGVTLKRIPEMSGSKLIFRNINLLFIEAKQSTADIIVLHHHALCRLIPTLQQLGKKVVYWPKQDAEQALNRFTKPPVLFKDAIFRYLLAEELKFAPKADVILSEHDKILERYPTGKTEKYQESEQLVQLYNRLSE